MKIADYETFSTHAVTYDQLVLIAAILQCYIFSIIRKNVSTIIGLHGFHKYWKCHKSTYNGEQNFCEPDTAK